MKFRITMKDPDGVYDSLQLAARESLMTVSGLTEAQRKDVHGKQVEALEEAASAWIHSGEYLTVEVDTEAKTCVVVSRD